MPRTGPCGVFTTTVDAALEAAGRMAATAIAAAHARRSTRRSRTRAPSFPLLVDRSPDVCRRTRWREGPRRCRRGPFAGVFSAEDRRPEVELVVGDEACDAQRLRARCRRLVAGLGRIARLERHELLMAIEGRPGRQVPAVRAPRVLERRPEPDHLVRQLELVVAVGQR